jgi:NADPH:quinone reductase-like Zn-dependent oxidoreductase
MKAVVHDRYGPPDVLRIEDVPKPVPAPDESSSGSARRG